MERSFDRSGKKTRTSSPARLYAAVPYRELLTERTEEHSYIYAGGKLLRETVFIVDEQGSEIERTLDFRYDNAGLPYALHYKDDFEGIEQTCYYITNLQGDVMYMVDESGDEVASYEYDPYGKLLRTTGDMAEVNPIRYRGYYYDNETSFYYLQSRYYDPAICRFINCDGFTTTGQGFLGYNMFTYCNNNPIKYADYPGTLMVCVTDESEENWKILNQIFEDATGYGVPVPMEQHVWEDAVAVVIHVDVQENVGYENNALLSKEEATFWTVIGIVSTICGLVAAVPTGGTSLALTGLGYASTAGGVVSTVVGAAGQFTADDIETAPSGYRKYTVTMSYLFDVHTHESSDGIGWKNLVTKEYVYYYSTSHRTLYDGNRKSYLGWTKQQY